MSEHPEIDPGDFRTTLGHFPTGVTVVTAAGAAGPVGMAIGSFTSVSLDPPLVMFCPGKESGTWLSIKDSGSFCANILGEDQKDTCGVFAMPSDDRFAGIEWTTDATGAPVLPGCVGHIDCDIHAILDGGDHDIVIGLVKSLAITGDQGPLLFFQGGYGRFDAL